MDGETIQEIGELIADIFDAPRLTGEMVAMEIDFLLSRSKRLANKSAKVSNLARH